MDIEGPLKISQQVMSLQLLTMFNGKGPIMRPYFAATNRMKEIVKSQESVSVPGGTRLRYQMNIPIVPGDIQYVGIKFEKFIENKFYNNRSYFTRLICL